MKIVYLSSAAIPNDWAHVIQIVTMSEAFGRIVEVELVVPRRKKAIEADLFEHYKLEKTFRVREVPCVDLSHTSASKVIFLVRLWSFFISAWWVLRGDAATVIYTREVYAAVFFKNVVYEMHAFPKKVSWFHRYAWRRMKMFVVLTEQIRSRLVGLGIPREIIHVEHDAVNIEKFDRAVTRDEARAELGLLVGAAIVGYVGTLKTFGMEKGVGIAIKAFREVPSSYRLCIVGGEPKDIAFYENMAAEYGVRHRVIFCGKVPHADIPSYIKACDIVVAPFPDHPHYRYFMSPLKVFEYMAARRAIITTDLESLREVFDDTTAVIVPPGDSSALARQMVRLVENPEIATQYADKAFERVREFTWEKRAQRILQRIQLIFS